MNSDERNVVIIVNAGLDIPTYEALAKLSLELMLSQQTLGTEFEKVLYDNLWDLYERS